MALRTHVIYTGRVQGVFFRATAHEISRRFAVTGFVRNLADGTVELEAQGASDQVQGLLDALAEHYRTNIQSIAVKPGELREGEREFRIEY